MVFLVILMADGALSLAQTQEQYLVLHLTGDDNEYHQFEDYSVLLDRTHEGNTVMYTFQHQAYSGVD